jgi:siroheme synthase
MAALARAGIPCEVVPGITSAVAVPAAADVPVTHRELASCVTIVTAHEDPEKRESSINWTWLAQAPGTVVVLMGLERVEALARRLIAEGRDPATPAIAIASGTLPTQQSVSASLAELPDEVTRAGLRSPAVIVIGDVAAFPASLVAEELAHAV